MQFVIIKKLTIFDKIIKLSIVLIYKLFCNKNCFNIQILEPIRIKLTEKLNLED